MYYGWLYFIIILHISSMGTHRGSNINTAGYLVEMPQASHTPGQQLLLVLEALVRSKQSCCPAGFLFHRKSACDPSCFHYITVN